MELPAANALLLAFCAASCASPSLAHGPDILPPEAASELLNQCSRDAPAAGESGWVPTAADVARFDVSISAALRERPPADRVDWTLFPFAWHAQYVGIVRGGRRYIYGNFLPRSIHESYSTLPRETASRSIVICDGGPAVFGAEYDLEAGRISHLAFNGSA